MKRGEVALWLAVRLTHEELLDGVHSQFLRFESDLVGVGRKAGGIAADFVWEGGGEEDDLEVFADALNEAV